MTSFFFDQTHKMEMEKETGKLHPTYPCKQEDSHKMDIQKPYPLNSSSTVADCNIGFTSETSSRTRPPRSPSDLPNALRARRQAEHPDEPSLAWGPRCRALNPQWKAIAPFVAMPRATFVASLLLVARPGALSSFLFLVASLWQCICMAMGLVNFEPPASKCLLHQSTESPTISTSQAQSDTVTTTCNIM